MSSQTVITILIAAAVITFVTFKQTRWTPVNLGRLLRLPVIFAVIGVVGLGNAGYQLPAAWHVGALDVAIIATELVLGVGAGLLMGRWTELRTVDGVTRSRLVGFGVAVWLGFIALRIGLAVLGHAEGATVAELQGTIFLVIAVVKSLQALVVRERVNRHRAAAADQARALGLR